MHINAKHFNSGFFVNSASYMFQKVLGKVPVYTILVLLMLSSIQFVTYNAYGEDKHIEISAEMLSYTVAPGGSFSVPFTLFNDGEDLDEYSIIIEDMPPSFQPRVYINGTESDTIKLEQGEILPGSVVIKAPWVIATETFYGNLTIFTLAEESKFPFNVSIVVPELIITTDSGVVVSDDGAYASIFGTLSNPSPVTASEVTLTIYVEDAIASEQGYERIAAGTNVSFVLRWPTSEGKASISLIAESKDGAQGTYEGEYNVVVEEELSTETIILVGGILALIFPLVVLAQTGIQRRREKKALERREREKKLTSSLMTIKEDGKK